MADVAKTTMPVLFGPPEDTASVSKIVMYVLLEPGEGDAASSGQGHVFAQTFRT